MLTAIKNALARWKRRRNAIALASRCFEEATGQRVIANMSKVISAESGRCVVRLCHGDTCPPQRTFYAVYDDGAHVRELTFEEAAEKYGVKPWR